MHSKHHIKIAGAGLSGMTAAIILKQHEYPVTIYEKRNCIGGRFKGDWQGIENWTSPKDVISEIEEMNLGLRFDYHPLPPLKLLLGDRHMYPISTQKPLCYLVKRGSDGDTLDQALYRRVRQLDIPIEFGKKLKSHEATIVATGPNSKKIFATDLGFRFTTDHPDIAVALVDNKAANKGYAYLLIVNGYGCLCTVLFKKFREIRNQLKIARNIFQAHFDLNIEDEEEVGGIGSYAMSDHYKLNGTYVGEAGGLQDFLFGFGIRTAMQSALLASRSIIEDFDYASSAKREFINLQKAGMVNRFIYEKIGGTYGGYKFMSQLVNKNGNPNYFLEKAYQYNFIHKMFYNLVRQAMKHRYKGII